MTQRTLAGLLAVPLLVVLWVLVLVTPLPYVTYRPGPTVDVLAEQEGEEIVQVAGQETFRTGGELRMTTVYVDSPEEDVTLTQLVESWLRDDEAVRPYDSVYPPGVTEEEKDRQSSVAMVSSQDLAIANALKALGYDVSPALEVLDVGEGVPAAGKLRVRDVILEIDGEEVTEPAQVARAVKDTPPGESVEFVVRRDDERRTVRVTPEDVDGVPTIGIVTGVGFQFPFDVRVDISDRIGGPSAGLMFALGIYDTLTPGSLTGGEVVAGTGTIAIDGSVGPIGGIQQKIAAADDAGAQLFLVPARNCEEALGAPAGDVRLVRVESFEGALESVRAWTEDHSADLPSCEEAT